VVGPGDAGGPGEPGAAGHPEPHEQPRPPALSFEGLGFAWPGSGPIFEGFDLTLGAGEKLFVSGPSGCGKSTLLSLAAGILLPQKGEVRLAGRALGSLSGPGRDRLRGDGVGYIFQQFNLVPYLSPLENVLLPCRFSAVRRRRALAGGLGLEGEAGRLLSRLSIPEGLWARPSARLSVGQQQRVAAARALIGGPGLLIADEPTSALDRDLALGFLRLLLRESDGAGSALLFVSHDASLATEFGRFLSLPGLAGADGAGP
jgi:putative ABC transport system ATP-binding protein